MTSLIRPGNFVTILRDLKIWCYGIQTSCIYYGHTIDSVAVQSTNYRKDTNLVINKGSCCKLVEVDNLMSLLIDIAHFNLYYGLTRLELLYVFDQNIRSTTALEQLAKVMSD